MGERLVVNWMYGGALAGLLLALLTPLIVAGWPPALTAAWVQLPLYMLHQWEEHDDDRFRRFVNRHVGGGREALSRLAVFVINVPGVWGVIAVSCWLATLRPGLAMIAIGLTLVNAVVHIAGFIALRAYNPGLVTAICGFAPIGVWAWLRTAPVATAADQAIGFGIAVLIHIAIIVHVKRAARPTFA
jgi:hypothetical protein